MVDRYRNVTLVLSYIFVLYRRSLREQRKTSDYNSLNIQAVCEFGDIPIRRQHDNNWSPSMECKKRERR